MMEIIDCVESLFGSGRRVSLKEEYEFTCPECMEKNHLHISLSKLVYICVTPGCTFRGNLRKLLDEDIQYSIQKEQDVDWKLITEIYEKCVEKATLRPFHREWLLSRGIKDMPAFSSDHLLFKLLKEYSTTELEEAGLVVTKEGSYRATRVLGPNRIVIPYRDYKTNECVYIRSRFAGKGAEVPYAAPSGVPGTRFVWGWDQIDPSYGYLGITEGEFKARAAQQIGFQVLGLPGMQSCHKAFLDGCSHFSIKYIYIIFDREAAEKQQNVECWETRLAEMAVERGFTVFIVRLPLLGKMKMDLDTYIQMSNNPTEDVKKLLGEAKEFV